MMEFKNNPKQCENCCHTRVCSLKDKLKAYIEEYDILNEKYGDFFPKNPSCPEYLSNEAINKHYHEMRLQNDKIDEVEDIKRKTYKSLVKDSNGKDKYFKESKKEEKQPLDKSKIFYIEPYSNVIGFVDDNGCYKAKKLSDEDIGKVLESILKCGF